LSTGSEGDSAPAACRPLNAGALWTARWKYSRTMTTPASFEAWPGAGRQFCREERRTSTGRIDGQQGGWWPSRGLWHSSPRLTMCSACTRTVAMPYMPVLLCVGQGGSEARKPIFGDNSWRIQLRIRVSYKKASGYGFGFGSGLGRGRWEMLKITVWTISAFPTYP
jgi:hypothetical protein